MPYTIAMSRALSGWGAGLAASCILVFGIGHANAQPSPDDGEAPAPAVRQERRPVAVIELGDVKDNRDLAEQLARALNNHPDLKPIDSSVAEDALRAPYRDEDAEWVERATQAKASAEAGVAGYKFPEAAKEADEGLIYLHQATPSARLGALSAELAFLLGAARLGERKDKLATEAFRFARVVDPTFKPDAVRYLPEVVQAFETAVKAPPAGKGYIEVGPGPGRIFLDGREVGTAPQTFPNVPVGIHVVHLVGAERNTGGTRVTVVADQKVKAELAPDPIDMRKRIQRARRALRSAPDAAARAAAMQQLAQILEVEDALLLTEANGKTVVQTWRARAPGFSALRERKDETAAELLRPLAPPKPTPPPRDPGPPPCPAGTSRLTPTGPCTPVVAVDTRAWYEKRRYQIAGGALGVVVIGVAIYALSNRYSNPVLDNNPGFEVRR